MDAGRRIRCGACGRDCGVDELRLSTREAAVLFAVLGAIPFAMDVAAVLLGVVRWPYAILIGLGLAVSLCAAFYWLLRRFSN